MSSSSSKLRTISVMPANLSVLAMFRLVSSGVVITFIPMNTFSSLPVNVPVKASARSGMINNMASVFTAQKVFLNNFESLVNHRIAFGKTSNAIKTL